MPIYPTLDKTWNFNVNQALSAQGTTLACNQNLLYQIINTLTTFSPGWQVRGASDSTHFGILALSAAGPYTGTGAWTSGSSCVWGTPTTAHSWIVLRNTALGGTYSEILISCDSSGSGGIFMWMSPGSGFTGGSTTSDPTASDQFQLNAGGSSNLSYGSQNAKVAYALHAMMSSDGQCTRVWVYSTGTFQSIWIIDQLKNYSTGWTTPWVVHTDYLLPTTGYWSTTTAYTFGCVNNLNSGGYEVTNLATQQFLWTGEGPNNLVTLAYNAPNDLNSLYPMTPIGLYAPSSTSPLRGRHGMWYDMWWGCAGPPFPAGQLYAGASAHAFVQIGPIIFPWDGSATMNQS